MTKHIWVWFWPLIAAVALFYGKELVAGMCLAWWLVNLGSALSRSAARLTPPAKADAPEVKEVTVVRLLPDDVIAVQYDRALPYEGKLFISRHCENRYTTIEKVISSGAAHS